MLESRKLAIIVFADIVGYSAMMQTDEKKALLTLDRFKTALEREMPKHEGEVVQYFGDGCLLSFDSAFHSVGAATALQQAFITEGVPVRIGMHLGDVLYKNNNAFGDGVNIASRIESLGVPGSVLVSKSIRDAIKNKTDFSLVSLGTFQFKNIAEPTEVFAISNPGFVIPKLEEMEGKITAFVPNPAMRNDLKEWERYQMLEILDAMEANKCVLILGNYAFSKPTPKPGSPEAESFLPELLLREQKKWAAGTTPENAPDYYSVAQSLIQKAGGQRMFMELTNIKLDDLGPVQKDRFRQLSEIPFDLILSTYPFDLLHEVFMDNQIAHQYDYYSFLQEANKLEPFDSERPLIYNLFGSVRHKESMVISLDRLYKFLFGILGVRQLPKVIQDKMQQATHLVFLGFSFDDWYMKLLLRMLKVHEKDISYAHPPGPAGLRKQNQMFFESNFQVTFLDKKIDDFVTEMHAYCDSEGMLRQKSPEAAISPYQNLQTLVAKYRLEEALGILDEMIIRDGKEGSLLRELGDFQRTYHKIKEWENYDSYSHQELEEKWQQLRNSLSTFIDQVATQIPA